MSYSDKKKKKRAIFNYFELFYTKFLKLIQLNFIYSICILPFVVGLVYITCVVLEVAPEVVNYSEIFKLLVNIAIHIPDYILIPLFIVSAIFYGPLTAGLTFCTRNIVSRKVFWVSDLFSRAKSNFKQGLILGLIDIFVFLSCLLYLKMDIGGNGMNFYGVIKFIAIFIAIAYFVMRFYTYTMAVTFELSIKDIFNNARLFLVLGFLKNLIAILIGLIVLISFISTPVIDTFLFFALYFSLCRFSAVFSTYPVIEKYMLKSKKAKNNDAENDSNK